jgi:hypothetical protein
VTYQVIDASCILFAIAREQSRCDFLAVYKKVKKVYIASFHTTCFSLTDATFPFLD